MLVVSDVLCEECRVKHVIKLPENISPERFAEDLRESRDNLIPINLKLPYLSDEDREKLQTGYCDEAWYKIFGDFEE